MQENHRAEPVDGPTVYRYSSSVSIGNVTPVRLRVKELRTAKGMTQAQLAKAASVREATLTAIEHGRTTGVDFDVLERLAAALGVDPGFLVVKTEARKIRQR